MAETDWGAVTTSLSLDGVFVHPNRLCESTDVGHRTRVWAFAHVLPGARIGGDCNVCDGAFVENGAQRALVSAGSVVISDAHAHGSVVGNAGRLIGWACTCDERLPVDIRCRCGRVFERQGHGLHQQAA